MTLGQRILDQLTELGKNQAWLCTKIEGLEIGTLNALVQRKSKNSSFAPLIASQLGVSLEWLITGQGREELGENNPGPIDAQKRQEVMPAAWPFKRAPQERYMQLTASQKEALEDSMIRIIDALLLEAPTEDRKKISNGA